MILRRLLEIAILLTQVVDIGKCVFKSLRAYIVSEDMMID